MHHRPISICMSYITQISRTRWESQNRWRGKLYFLIWRLHPQIVLCPIYSWHHFLPFLFTVVYNKRKEYQLQWHPCLPSQFSITLILVVWVEGRLSGNWKPLRLYLGMKWANRCIQLHRLFLKDAGIENFHWHDLRHTAASYIAMNGATQGELQTILGHRSVASSARYRHFTQQHIHDVLSKNILKKFVQISEWSLSTPHANWWIGMRNGFCHKIKMENEKKNQ